MRILVLIVVFITIGISDLSVFGQNRIIDLENELELFSKDNPAMNEPVDLSVSNSSLSEFIRGIAIANGINVDVDPSVNKYITNNFSNAKVKNVFLYICKRYDLDIDITGSILTFNKYVPEVVEKKYQPKLIDVTFNGANEFVSFDLKLDTLELVAKKITEVTGKNVVLSPKSKDKKISIFIKNRPFEDALDKLCLSNDLTLTKTTDNFYYIDVLTPVAKQNTPNKFNQVNGKNGVSPTKDLIVSSIDAVTVTVDAKNVSVQKIIEEVSNVMGENYFLYSTPQNNSTLYIENATYEEFLKYALNSSDHSFKKEKDVYLIGNRKDETLRQTKLVELENRRVENVLESIPKKLVEGIEISEFVELNALVVSGSAVDIRELEDFVTLIDVIVPVITIEIIIADVNDTKALTTGIQAGLNDGDGAPATTTGTISPGVDVDLSTGVINDVIDGVNGLGIVNLGYISPSFYLKIKALEENGDVNIKSTPTVATLNGHETTMKIGDEQYYLEVNNQIVNNQLNPNVYQSQQWKSVTADLAITVTPSISKDEQVTLDIKVEQSTFTTKVSETAPPGQTKRSFESLIRVKNGEMILLGGLDENSKVETASGLPLLSRIPIIKWLFGNRTKSKTKKQLTIFIRPVVSYQ